MAATYILFFLRGLLYYFRQLFHFWRKLPSIAFIIFAITQKAYYKLIFSLLCWRYSRLPLYRITGNGIIVPLAASLHLLLGQVPHKRSSRRHFMRFSIPATIFVFHLLDALYLRYCEIITICDIYFSLYIITILHITDDIIIKPPHLILSCHVAGFLTIYFFEMIRYIEYCSLYLFYIYWLLNIIESGRC